jgi:F-type H+-transporting ATPase subunit b
MNLNATMLVQTVVFIILALITMKFIWPPLIKALEERQKKIAEGLAAAEKGEKNLSEAKSQANELIKEARVQATKIIEQANRRSSEMIEEAKGVALADRQRKVAETEQEVALQSSRAREQLRREVASIALAGAGKLLGREVDAKAHSDLLEQLAVEIERG